MSRITLFPVDGNASVDNNLAQNVDFTGIDPTIHCVQWYDTFGWVEYVSDLQTGAKPPNQDITSIAPYQTYVNNAQVIINAYLNPLVVYSTEDGLVYGDLTYTLGGEIVIDTPNTLPPAQSTNEVPGTPEDFQQLWWYAAQDTWVISPVNPTSSLSAAQDQLISQVQTSGAEQADYQARIYSAYQLVSSGSVGALPTADYFGLDLDTYQTYIDGQIASMTATINAATSVPDLYQFDWRVEGNPNA